MSHEERAELIKKNPLYGKIICRCETVTEGEIVDALHRPIVPVSIDGIKRRCNAGMGRCQGGFCGPRVQEIIARELGIPQEEVVKDRAGMKIITGETKEVGGAN
jgi:glycerol-3-phosphate dehydrogenase